MLNSEIKEANTEIKAKWTKLGIGSKKTYTDAERKVVDTGDKIHEVGDVKNWRGYQSAIDIASGWPFSETCVTDRWLDSRTEVP